MEGSEMDIFSRKHSPEELTGEFRASLGELEETPTELAKRMRELGDHREFATILRSIQRMQSGEIGVSGEMKTIVNIIVRQQRLNKKEQLNIIWKQFENGTVSATYMDFSISLHSKTKGRWHVHLVHIPTGYSPSWPAWQNNLDAAKRKALTCLKDALNDLDDIERQAKI